MRTILASGLSLSCILLITFIHASAQNNELGAPFITNYKSGKDIMDTQYWAAVQDHRGILYFAINTGIVEFDGVEYKSIQTASSTIVRSLCYGADSIVYAGGDKNFGYLAFTNTGETIFVSLVDKLKPKDRKFSTVTKVFYADSSVWFLTDDTGVFKLKGDSIQVIPANLLSRFGNMAHEKLFLFQADSQGIVVVENDSLVYLPHTRKFTSPDVGKTELLPYPGNKLLIITKNRGLYLYHYDELLHQPKPYSDENTPATIVEKFITPLDDYLIQNIVYPCIQLDSTQYAFGTLMGGVIIMDVNGKLVRVINESRGLYDNVVFGLYADNHKNLWALMHNGVSYIETSSPISSFTTTNKTGKSPYFIKKNNSKLYLSHDKGISYLSNYSLSLENDNHRFNPIKLIKGGVSRFHVYNDIILCEADGKLYAIHQDKSKFIGNIPPASDIIRSSRFKNCFFYCSQASGAGYFQLSDTNGKIHNGALDTVKVTRTYNYKNLPSCEAILEDPSGNIILLTSYEGIIHLKFKNNNIHEYTVVQYDTVKGAPNGYSSIAIYKSRMFINSKKGLLEAVTYPEKSSTWDSIHTFIPERFFSAQLPFELSRLYNVEGNLQLWFITKDKRFGLLSEGKEGKISYQFMPFRGILPETISVDKDNIYWIISNGVVYRYDPSVQKNYDINFSALIRKITIGEDSVIFNGTYITSAAKRDDHYLRSTFHQTDITPSIFEFTSNSVKFECAATSYEAIEKNKYSYYLKGVDKTWSEWSAKPSKEYSYLPAGEYTFHVKAINAYGKESSVSTYYFQILSPWYKTWTAYIGFIILFTLIILGTVRLYYNNLIRTKKYLKKVVRKRTRAFRQKNKELNRTLKELKELENFKESMIHMIVHDLKNPLNTIIGFAQVKQDAKMKAFILHSGKTMLNMVENILNVHKFEESKIKLNAEVYNINQVINEAIQEISFIAAEKEITIILKMISFSFLFDVELIKRVLVNLLSNAVKFSPEKEDIIVDVKIIDENQKHLVKISICDHGIGIPEKMTEKIFDKYVQVEARKLGIAHSTGLGLTFCKLVVEAHKGRIGVESGIDKGSIFYFTLPIF
jgi:signal transduction histidine kinase